MLVVALYGAQTFDVGLIGAEFIISNVAAIAAGVTLATSVAAMIIRPKKFLSQILFGVYLLLSITVGALLYEGGITTSPFIVLGVLLLLLAGLFGAASVVAMAVIVNGFLLLDLFVWQHVLTETAHIVTFLVAYETPLIASLLLWRKRRNGKSEQEKAFHDLTKELHKVSNKAEIVINAIGDGVIATDGKGVIQLINPAAQHIIGWDQRDAIGLDYRSVLKLLSQTNEPLTDATHPVAHTLRTNDPVSTEDCVLETNSGKKLNVSVLTSAVGQPGAGAIIVFRDITKRKAEQREQFEFISTASHEMRTPVASIEGYLGLALNPATATIDDKARLYLGKAREASQHLGRLFQDLLDISRAEDGRLKSNPKVVDVAAFTDKVVDDFAVRAKQKGLILFFKPTTGNATTAARKVNPIYYSEVDNDHLREVLSNLIDNAIKYTTSGDISVDIKGDTEQITISVSDTGIGIPPEDIPHLFQKFYRVDTTDTREIGGTGLGLYLSRQLVEHWGGRIWVESDYHKGSTFYVTLPRISHEEATEKIERNAKAAPTPPAPVQAPTPLPPTHPAAIPAQAPIKKPATPPPTSPPAAPKPLQNTPPVSPKQPATPVVLASPVPQVKPPLQQQTPSAPPSPHTPAPMTSTAQPPASSPVKQNVPQPPATQYFQPPADDPEPYERQTIHIPTRNKNVQK